MGGASNGKRYFGRAVQGSGRLIRADGVLKGFFSG